MVIVSADVRQSLDFLGNRRCQRISHVVPGRRVRHYSPKRERQRRVVAPDPDSVKEVYAEHRQYGTACFSSK